MTRIRIVRRGLTGTARPHRTARPTGTSPVEIVPATPGLPGAACKGADPDLFFAEPDEDDTDADRAAVEFATRRAKAICAVCPVRESCLALALDREAYGVFGGLTADERRRMKRRIADANRTARTVPAEVAG